MTALSIVPTIRRCAYKASHYLSDEVLYRLSRIGSRQQS
jgi:hypothetical protein